MMMIIAFMMFTEMKMSALLKLLKSVHHFSQSCFDRSDLCGLIYDREMNFIVTMLKKFVARWYPRLLMQSHNHC